jgi:maleylpyruvate isomerase
MDPEVRESLARIAEATERLLASAGRLTDDGVREPSLLPGWTRGHVLTHLARNADGLGSLLRGAAAGQPARMYASPAARNADIEADAGRPAADLIGDVTTSAARFAALAGQLPDDVWTAEVQALAGEPFPASGALRRRLSELEIHHVDLAAGYRPGDWAAGFVADTLARVAGDFTGRADTPPCLVQAEGWPDSFQLGPPQPPGVPQVSVHGQPADVLAWLLGRDPGSRLRVAGEHPVLPVLPAWR